MTGTRGQPQAGEGLCAARARPHITPEPPVWNDHRCTWPSAMLLHLPCHFPVSPEPALSPKPWLTLPRKAGWWCVSRERCRLGSTQSGVCPPGMASGAPALRLAVVACVTQDTQCQRAGHSPVTRGFISLGSLPRSARLACGRHPPGSGDVLSCQRQGAETPPKRTEELQTFTRT